MNRERGKAEEAINFIVIIHLCDSEALRFGRYGYKWLTVIKMQCHMSEPEGISFTTPISFNTFLWDKFGGFYIEISVDNV